MYHRLHQIKISVSLALMEQTSSIQELQVHQPSPKSLLFSFKLLPSAHRQIHLFPQHPPCSLMQHRTTASCIYQHRGVGEDCGAGGPRGWPAGGEHTKWPTSETIKIHQKSKTSVADSPSQSGKKLAWGKRAANRLC